MKNQNREENSTDIDEILKRISGGSDKPPYRRVVEYYFSVDGKDLKVRHRGRDSVRVRWSGWDFEVGGGLETYHPGRGCPPLPFITLLGGLWNAR